MYDEKNAIVTLINSWSGFAYYRVLPSAVYYMQVTETSVVNNRNYPRIHLYGQLAALLQLAGQINHNHKNTSLWRNYAE